jgi:hypothetical protein
MRNREVLLHLNVKIEESDMHVFSTGTCVFRRIQTGDAERN